MRDTGPGPRERSLSDINLGRRMGSPRRGFSHSLGKKGASLRRGFLSPYMPPFHPFVGGPASLYASLCVCTVGYDQHASLCVYRSGYTSMPPCVPGGVYPGILASLCTWCIYPGILASLCTQVGVPALPAVYMPVVHTTNTVLFDSGDDTFSRFTVGQRVIPVEKSLFSPQEITLLSPETLLKGPRNPLQRVLLHKGSKNSPTPPEVSSGPP